MTHKIIEKILMALAYICGMIVGMVIVVLTLPYIMQFIWHISS